MPRVYNKQDKKERDKLKKKKKIINSDSESSKETSKETSKNSSIKSTPNKRKTTKQIKSDILEAIKLLSMSRKNEDSST